MNNNIIFGQYYEANSLIHKLDPRIKFIGMIFMIISLFLINNLYVLLGYSLLLLLLVMLTKTPLKKFLKSIKSMFYIMFFTFILQILTQQDSSQYNIITTVNFNLTWLNLGIICGVLLLWMFLSKYIKVFKFIIFTALFVGIFVLQHYINLTPNIVSYSISFSKEGIENGSYLVIRFIDCLLVASLLTLTTKPTQINNAIEKLLKPLSKIGINVGVFSMIVSITFRFIPTLLLEAKKVLKAQASRGADFEEANLLSKVLQMTSLVIPLFIITYKNATDLSYAMEARGYVEKNPRSSLYELKYYTKDYLSIVFVMMIFAFSIVSRFIF